MTLILAVHLLPNYCFRCALGTTTFFRISISLALPARASLSLFSTPSRCLERLELEEVAWCEGELGREKRRNFATFKPLTHRQTTTPQPALKYTNRQQAANWELKSPPKMLQPWKEASSLIIVARAQMKPHVTSNSKIIKSSIVESLMERQQLQLKQQNLQDADSQIDNAQYQDGAQTSTTTFTTTTTTTPTTSASQQDVDSCDYRVMMVKRSGLSSFLASAYVFPGGRVEPADFSGRWWSLFDKFNLTREDLALFSQSIKGPRPPIVLEPRTVQESQELRADSLPADIGLRISALRETFEETGVLLLTRPGDDADSYQPLSDNHQLASNVDLSTWRDRVRKDAGAFLELCLETNLCPNIWSLYEWWNWLTPTSVGHKRCDTMFYICFLEVEPKVVLDNEEVTTLKVSFTLMTQRTLQLISPFEGYMKR